MNPIRVAAAGTMLAWAYFVALWHSDWIRASQILVTLQQFFQAHLDVFGQGLAASSREIFGSMQVTGMYDQGARLTLQRALFYGNVFTGDQLVSMPMSCPATGRCPATAGAGAAGTWAATSLIPLKSASDPIWAAWNVANSVEPQDVAPHLTTWAQNFVDGVDTSAAHQAVATPEQITTPGPQQVPQYPVGHPGDITPLPWSSALQVPGTNLRQATDPIWYWAIGAVAVTTIGVGLMFFPWHKSKHGRRR